VGHTDAMFFQFFEASDVAVSTAPDDIIGEAEMQLDLVEVELARIVGAERSRMIPGSPGH
jgi:hypothetical protein